MHAHSCSCIYLSVHTTCSSVLLKGVDVTVLRAAREARSRFTYYHDVTPENRGSSLMAPPPVNARILMTWEEFYQKLRHRGA